MLNWEENASSSECFGGLRKDRSGKFAHSSAAFETVTLPDVPLSKLEKPYATQTSLAEMPATITEMPAVEEAWWEPSDGIPS
jgi:hypothetical protein